tara:strand:- start:30 stop:1319 length:1290 start_codon:yes stop_codon:yes gene_type:complete
MANSASAPSKYEEMVISRTRTTAGGQGNKSRSTTKSLRGKVTSFSYYESLYSPTTTASVTYTESTESTKNLKEITGNEDFTFKIQSKYGTLEFGRKKDSNSGMKVKAAPTIAQESNREAVFLDLASKWEFKNKTTAVHDKYSNVTIGDAVIIILKRKLGVDYDFFDVEETKNMYDFNGRGKSPFELITDLARKAVPVKGDPGFFFYETQDGFNFKSIQSLVSQEPKQVYVYNGSFRNDQKGDSNDFKILKQPRFLKDQDIITALESGTYASRNIFFNPFDKDYIERIYKINDDGGIDQALGNSIEVDDELTGYIRTHTHILDVGSLKVGVSTSINNTPAEWQAKSAMRYNILHSQIVELMVPCNTELRAGDVVKLEFESLANEKCAEGIDKRQSGKYLILHLCHYFDPNKSVTSLTVCRDTYGLHTSKK